METVTKVTNEWTTTKVTVIVFRYTEAVGRMNSSRLSGEKGADAKGNLKVELAKLFKWQRHPEREEEGKTPSGAQTI